MTQFKFNAQCSIRIKSQIIFLLAGFLFCVFLLIFPTGCSDGQNSAAPSSPAQTLTDGSAAISLRWHSRSAESGYEIKALSDCSQEGVSHIKCNVYADDRETLLLEGDEWECASRRGTLENIPAGRNRQFVCMGLDGGNIVHLGQISNVTINPGEKTVIESPIDLYPFATRLNSPEDGAQVNINRFDMQWDSVDVDYPIAYHVQIATDRTFENIVEDGTTTQVSYAPGQLLPDTTYYWRVFPEDLYGNQGPASGTRRFVTLPGAECRSPSLAPIENISVNAGDPVNIALNATDQDVGDRLTFSYISDPPLPDEAQLNPATGRFTWPTTPADIGTYDITFSVQDSCEDGPLAVSEDVTITVGEADGSSCQPPELNAIGSRNIGEGQFFSLPLSADDPDTALNLLVYSYSPDNLLRGAQLEENIFSWTPPPGSAGEYTVSFEVCDDCTPQPQCDDETIVITVATAQNPSEFQPPRLVSPRRETPMDNGCDLDFNPIEWDFEWSQVANADRYRIAVLRGETTVIERNTLTPRLSYTCDESNVEISNCRINPLESTGWSWRVQAGYTVDNVIQWSDWSEQRALTFEPINTDCEAQEVLQPPTPLRPTSDDMSMDNGCTTEYEDIRWTFSWSAVPGAVSYEIEILQDGEDSILSEQNQGTQFIFTCDTYPQIFEGCVIRYFETNSYSWHVRAIGADNRESDWSEQIELSIEAPNTDCPYRGEAPIPAGD